MPRLVAQSLADYARGKKETDEEADLDGDDELDDGEDDELDDNDEADEDEGAEDEADDGEEDDDAEDDHAGDDDGEEPKAGGAQAAPVAAVRVPQSSAVVVPLHAHLCAPRPNSAAEQYVSVSPMAQVNLPGAAVAKSAPAVPPVSLTGAAPLGAATPPVRRARTPRRAEVSPLLQAAPPISGPLAGLFASVPVNPIQAVYVRRVYPREIAGQPALGGYGTLILPDEADAITVEDLIRASWGGGIWEVRAIDSDGKRVRDAEGKELTARVTTAGTPRLPTDQEQAKEKPAAPPPPPPQAPAFDALEFARLIKTAMNEVVAAVRPAQDQFGQIENLGRLMKVVDGLRGNNGNNSQNPLDMLNLFLSFNERMKQISEDYGGGGKESEGESQIEGALLKEGIGLVKDWLASRNLEVAGKTPGGGQVGLRLASPAPVPVPNAANAAPPAPAQNLDGAADEQEDDTVLAIDQVLEAIHRGAKPEDTAALIRPRVSFFVKAALKGIDPTQAVEALASHGFELTSLEQDLLRSPKGQEFLKKFQGAL